MRDLTKGPMFGLLIAMSVPIMIGMLVQTLYVLIDLYFVSRLGPEAVAGVSTGTTFFFVTMGLSQMVAVATLSLMSRATGAMDREKAILVFNQSISLAALFTVIVLIVGYGFAPQLLEPLAANPAILKAALLYVYAYLPGLAMQFIMAALGSALRAVGITQPTMVVQLATVGCNIILAPILIAGLGTGYPLGVMGAGLASTISVLIGLILIALYFVKVEHFIVFKPEYMKPRLSTWGEMLKIGVPSGGEFVLMAVFASVIYWAMRPFGAEAQAGYAIGGRINQMLFLPAMAVAFAMPAIAGQNFGAGEAARVRQSLNLTIRIEIALMLIMTAIVQIKPEWLMALFTNDPVVVKNGVSFLRYTSLNFLASGIVFACSGLFQGVGTTVPSVLSAALRLLTFVMPVVWFSRQTGFQLETIWITSVASVALQAVISYLLARREMTRKLTGLTPRVPVSET